MLKVKRKAVAKREDVFWAEEDGAVGCLVVGIGIRCLDGLGFVVFGVGARDARRVTRG